MNDRLIEAKLHYLKLDKLNRIHFVLFSKLEFLLPCACLQYFDSSGLEFHNRINTIKIDYNWCSMIFNYC